MLVYPIFKPWNLSGSYKNFVRVGEPIEWPYAQTLDGGRIYVQAMVCEGEALAAGVAEAERYGYELLEDEKGLRFDAPYAISSKRIEARARAGIVPAAPDEIVKRVAA